MPRSVPFEPAPTRRRPVAERFGDASGREPRNDRLRRGTAPGRRRSVRVEPRAGGASLRAGPRDGSRSDDAGEEEARRAAGEPERREAPRVLEAEEEGPARSSPA